jgi:hypothetical protein
MPCCDRSWVFDPLWPARAVTRFPGHVLSQAGYRQVSAQIYLECTLGFGRHLVLRLTRHSAAIPPSTTIAVPVTYDDALLSR